MTSEEYVNQVNRLMDLQTTYLNIFLGFLGVVIAIMLALQWWLNSRQMKQIKELTKQETIKEIEESLGVSSLHEFKKDMQKNIADTEKKQDVFAENQIKYELTKLYNQKDIDLWRITYLMDIYESYIQKTFNNFNNFVSSIDGLIFSGHNEGKISIQSKYIDKIIQKLSEFEKIFNENSEKLNRLRNEVKYYRDQE